MVQNRISGLNGTIPTQYDPIWPVYTDLNAVQIAAFQAFPQDLINYTSIKRWQKEIAGMVLNNMTIVLDATGLALLSGLAIRAQRDQSANASTSYTFTSQGNCITLSPSQALALFDAVSVFIQQCRSAEGVIVGNINSGLITSRSQVDSDLSSISNAIQNVSI